MLKVTNKITSAGRYRDICLALIAYHIKGRHYYDTCTTFQYIHPSDGHKLGQAELVCIDEAAAIPLPLVRELLGPYLVFLSSTVNG